jgi:hypothetical protein
MMIRRKVALAAIVMCTNPFWPLSLGQAPPVVLIVDVDKVVNYEGDVSDVTKLASATTQTTGTPARNFFPVLWIADIVAVNGGPARGTWTVKGNQLSLSRTPGPGTGIADSGAALFFDWVLDIQQADGTPVGTIMASGWGGATKPPGAPSTFLQANMAVTGGTGAFLGVRGQAGQGGNTVFPRLASMSEDPALRRVLGGGTRRYVFHLFPLFQPQILGGQAGPAIFHSDFTAVTGDKPARAGELLIAQASGLGPTLPGVDPGNPFPATMLQPVNSPVQVFVDGQPVDVLTSIGWPGKVDVYRIDFRLPSTISSKVASVQLTVAWMSGAAVQIPVQ